MVERYSYAQARSAEMARSESASFDAGLRSHMLKVYNFMVSALLITGIVSLVVSQSPAIMGAIWDTGLSWVAILSPLVFVLIMSGGASRFSSGTLQVMFWAFAAAMGLSMSMLMVLYTGESVARTFFITAAAFGGLSLYGYTTKRNLSGIRSFLVMGVLGLLLAMIVNIFLQSSMMQFVIASVGVLIFAGLTAYDTQRIREEYYMMSSGEAVQKGAIFSALSLYLDFINMFRFLLYFLGERE